MDWVSVVKDIGFPIVVALILLLKLDASLNRLRESIDDLKDAMKETILRMEADRGGKG